MHPNASRSSGEFLLLGFLFRLRQNAACFLHFLSSQYVLLSLGTFTRLISSVRDDEQEGSMILLVGDILAIYFLAIFVFDLKMETEIPETNFSL